jgi:hypothetical protein
MSKKKNRASIVFLFGLLGVVAAACGGGGAAIGAACTTPGNQDECVSGGVCDNDVNGTAVCLEICTVDTDCEADEACNGVSSTNIKACHVKK